MKHETLNIKKMNRYSVIHFTNTKSSRNKIIMKSRQIDIDDEKQENNKIMSNLSH